MKLFRRQPIDLTGVTRGTFTPGAGAVDLRFVVGNDGFALVPEALARAGFRYRFAVVQESYVEGCVDMYFDEPLWRTLVAFVRGFGDTVTVLNHPRPPAPKEEPLESFMERWSRTDPEDTDPPWAMLALSDGVLKLGMTTDGWFAVGGPQPYSDSYTYSLYSDRDLSEEVLAFLQSAPVAGRWRVELPAHVVPEAKRKSSKIAPGPLTRFLERLFRR
jgi:hypothetical protein